MIDFFFFNDTATTEIYTLSLHDALPISEQLRMRAPLRHPALVEHHDLVGVDHRRQPVGDDDRGDRKSTRLNSSHANISYAVFCLKKKKQIHTPSCICPSYTI